jgi:hypothetical protein
MEKQLSEQIDTAGQWLTQHRSGRISLAFYKLEKRGYFGGDEKNYWEKWSIPLTLASAGSRKSTDADVRALLWSVIQQCDSSHHVPHLDDKERNCHPFDLMPPPDEGSWSFAKMAASLLPQRF